VYEGAQHIALIGKTPADVRDVMIQNPLKSGLIDVFPPHERPVYIPSKSAVRFLTGAIAHVYSGEAPETLRGPAHSHFWADEICTWQYPVEAYDNLMLGLRVGAHPRGVITTTPRPVPLLRRILADSSSVLTRVSTHDNLDNLADSFKLEVLRQYEGTRLERQEIYGELLEDVEGALWTYDLFRYVPTAPLLAQIVVAIDPAATATEASDETGIIVTGRDEQDYGYVLADYSGRYSPDGWASRALDAYEQHQADRIVCETNNGGDMVVHTIQTAARARGARVRVQKVTASRGKYARAEPIAMLYEQHRIMHVGQPGTFAKLEEQLCQWAPSANMASPDRLDAMTWGLHVLMVLRRGVMRQSGEADVEAAPEPAAPSGSFAETVTREGMWFPRG
jgi:predicted phage terminase large subunit-like protein